MFAHDAKDEIASVHNERPCCAATFVDALLRFGAKRSGDAQVVSTARAATARAFVAATHAGGLAARVSRAPSHAGARWVVILDPALKSSSPSMPLALPRRICCRRALLRAAFLACGSVNDPARGYHLEFFCRTDGLARIISSAIAAFGGDAGLTRRRNRALVYVKDAQTVSMLLANMGATRALLRLEEHRALRQTKNSTRRIVNSEAANAARTADSAARQREAARRVLASANGQRLPRTVREAARLRIAYPARTLAELARAARPSITKAAMASRMRLLERLSKR